MSDHDPMNHEDHVFSGDREPAGGKLTGLLRSRLFAIVVTAVALGAGLLLARKLGVGGNLLAGIGIFAFMMFGHSLMHGGHGSRGGHCSHGGHGGCGGASYQRYSSSNRSEGSRESRDSETEPHSGDDSETAESPQHHQGGCH